ncbi:MAG: TPM domain-containing protein [Terriglobia bacterium]
MVFAAAARAQKISGLKPTGYVNDFAGVISATARAQLGALCTEVDQRAHAQIAVVTVRSLDGDTIDDYANNLFTRWGIGGKKTDRGVLILVSPSDHKYRVEVGYGLEPILPDGKVGDFGRAIVPDLRRGDYSGALVYITAEIAQVIAAASHVTLASAPGLPTRRLQRQGQQLNPIPIIFILAMLGFGGFGLFGPLFFGGGRRRGGWGGGPWIGGWGGGGFGGLGGGGGGGGFGGFGGGMSGGGGASGSW